jgi:ABC-2 type transport system permease protein
MTLNNTTVIEYHRVPPGVSITQYIQDNSINTALVIPAGFGDNVTRASGGDPSAAVNVTLYGDPTLSTFGIAAGAVSAAATQMNFVVAGARPVIGMDTATISQEPFKFIDFFLPGMIGFTVLTNALFAMTPTAAEYRTRKYFKFLATTTLTKGEWLLAKVLFYTIIMSVSALIMFGVSALLWGGRATLTPLTFAFIAAGCFEFTSLGMALGMYAKDVETASAVANAIGFPMMFLGGTFFQIEAMPPVIQGLAAAMPLTYLSEGLRATMIFGNEGKALLYLGITLVLGFVFFLIPAKLLSWKSK